MKYRDMVIEASASKVEPDADRRSWRQFAVRVQASPAGEMAPGQSVQVRCDEKALQGLLVKLAGRTIDRKAFFQLGRLLGLLLLPPARGAKGIGVREFVSRSIDLLGQDTGLRLRLVLPPDLAGLPWEFAYLDRLGTPENADAGFLALDPRVAIVRHEALPVPAHAPRAAGDITVLAALASPPNLDPLDLDQEERDLRQALGEQAGVHLTVLKDATVDTLQNALSGANVFHFAGHAAFEPSAGGSPSTAMGIGAIALDDGIVDAQTLGMNLRGHGVQLVVLGGCETGRRAGASVWSGIAPALVRFEVPAVVANQYSIRDDCAIAFSRRFYGALAGGLPIEQAVSVGRLAAFNIDKTSMDWGVPVLYLRGSDGDVFGGATDAQVRDVARASAQADVDVRLDAVAAGGFVIGAKLRKMLDGKLSVKVVVAGAIYGDVVGLKAPDGITGGSVRVTVKGGTVGPRGRLTGAIVGTVGRADARTKRAPLRSEAQTVQTAPDAEAATPTQARGAKHTSLATTRVDMHVDGVHGGQVMGLVGKVIQGDYVDKRVIVAAGPEGLKEIVRMLAQAQKIDQRPLRDVLALHAPDSLGRQINAIVAAQRELAAGGAAQDAPTSYRLGMLAAYRRDYDTALSYFRHSTQADPEYRVAFAAISWLQQSRAMSDLNVGDYDAAVARIAEAREAAMHTDPLDAGALAQRGYIYKTLAQVAESQRKMAERRKYYDEAARLFEQAAKLDPTDAGARNGLANVHHALGRLDDAIADYRLAIALAPRYTAAHHDLALAYEDKLKAHPSAAKRWRDKALTSWREAYRLAPDDPGFSAQDVLGIGQRIDWLSRQPAG